MRFVGAPTYVRRSCIHRPSVLVDPHPSRRHAPVALLKTNHLGKPVNPENICRPKTIVDYCARTTCTQFSLDGPGHGFVHFRMMIFGIVGYNHNTFTLLSASSLKELHKVPEALPVKSIGLSCIDKRAIPQAHCTEISHVLARGVVKYYGITVLWRHPHAAPVAVLLKMDLIQCP